ncbi:MAG: TSUP family transporter [Congregibacter sp.]
MLQTLVEAFTQIGFPQMLAIWGGIMLAALLRAFTGFGFSLGAVPVLSLFVAPTDAVVITLGLLLTVSVFSIKKYWTPGTVQPLVPILLFAILGTAVGASLLRSLSVVQFQLWIGLGVVLACLALSFYRPKALRVGFILRAVTGLCSGLMNGALAIAGPPIIILTMATESSAQKSRAILMTYFMFISVIGLLMYATLGYITVRSLCMLLLALPAMLLGDALGHAVFSRFGTQMHRTIALGALYFVGIGTTTKALSDWSW